MITVYNELVILICISFKVLVEDVFSDYISRKYYQLHTLLEI